MNTIRQKKASAVTDRRLREKGECDKWEKKRDGKEKKQKKWGNGNDWMIERISTLRKEVVNAGLTEQGDYYKLDAE